MTSFEDWDANFIERAFLEAKGGLEEGGLPIGAVLARGADLIAAGRNQRVQRGDPIAHGEMDCLRKAGRQRTYRDTTLYTSLSPCMMCAGTIVQFKIPRVVINDTENFGGNEDFLREHGVTVIDAAHLASIEQMRDFIRTKPALWSEDIADA
ncbi:MAG: nucleoside deaminase [Pseudomonadota bacterium]